MDPVMDQPLTLYRGVAMTRYPDLSFLKSVDDVAEYIFNEPYPPLASEVARRYNTVEALRRYHEMRAARTPEHLTQAVHDHYRGDREYSVFVSATPDEDQAVFFAGNSLRDNPFGLVVRFTRDRDFELFQPAPRGADYTEVLVAGSVEPRDIDKILVVGCKAPNQMVIDFLYKRHSNGRVRKYRNAAHMRYTYLRGVKFSPDRFFDPPLEQFRES